VKPGDHPEFFRFPAPEGRSRESTIRLDSDGYFWHEGARVEHPKLAAAMHTWIARHPDDGRFILTNGYDWTYFTVEDVPYFVRSVRIEPDHVDLVLSDDTVEAWRPADSWIGKNDAVYTHVKNDAFEARFSRHAQTSLAVVLEEKDGQVWVVLGQTRTPLQTTHLAREGADATLVHRG
jgi:hypothetical protein